MLKKTASVITFALAMTSFAHASTSTCYAYDQNLDVVGVSCELTTLIDFNENSAQENASMSFSDWNTKLQGSYEQSVGDGSTTVIGNHGEYNFHGVKGNTENLFLSGESVQVEYTNTGTEAQSFYPMISFDDPDSRTIKNDDTDGFWLRSDEPVTINPGENFTQTWSFTKSFKANLINTNVNHNAVGQQDVLVNNIRYLHMSEDVAVSPCAKILSDNSFYSDSSCDKTTLVEFKQTKLATEKSMMSPTFNGLLGSEKWQVSNSSGSGRTTLKLFSNNVATVDSTFLSSVYSHMGVTSESGETHTFHAGDVIQVDLVAPYDLTMTLSPKISFNDPDTLPWGEPGTWHSVGSQLIENGEVSFFYTFTKETEGDYSLVNFSLTTDNEGKVAVSKMTYFAKPSL